MLASLGLNHEPKQLNKEASPTRVLPIQLAPCSMLALGIAQRGLGRSRVSPAVMKRIAQAASEVRSE